MYDTVVDAFGKATPTFVNQLAGFFVQRVGANIFRPEQTAGQHRRQGQRHQAGDQNRDADRDREFAKQAAQNSAHEQHRNEYRDQ